LAGITGRVIECSDMPERGENCGRVPLPVRGGPSGPWTFQEGRDAAPLLDHPRPAHGIRAYAGTSNVVLVALSQALAVAKTHCIR
jgi:hypothetical protein